MKKADIDAVIDGIDLTLQIIFTIEYLARLWSCVAYGTTAEEPQ